MSDLPKIEYIKLNGSKPSFFEKVAAFRIGAQQVPMPPWWVFAIVFFIAIVVASVVVANLNKQTATPANVKTTLDSQRVQVQNAMSVYYKNRQDVRTLLRTTPASVGPQVQENESSFINFAPLTCQDTGYIGPLDNGVFAEADSVNMALRAGARCFVLNIDYHEDQILPVDLFGKPGEPRLIYRDEGGASKCINTGDIQLVTQALANVAFSNTVSNMNDPLIVVLFFQREPKGSLDDKLVYYSKVAEKLSPLVPYHLGQTPQGDYHRQQKQNDLIYQPITDFEKKIIIMTNVDTSPFRTKQYSPLKDLDYFVHLRLYKDSTDTYGATGSVDSKTMPRGIVNSVTNFTIIPQDKYKDASDSTKMRWTMAYTHSAKNPTLKSINYMTKTLGVQCIPLWMFSTAPVSAAAMKDVRTPPKAPITDAPAPPLDEKYNEEDFPRILALWSQASYIPKPKNIRFIRPAPFTPAKQPTSMDANQGKLTQPNI